MVSLASELLPMNIMWCSTRMWLGARPVQLGLCVLVALAKTSVRIARVRAHVVGGAR
jgi:hypothetical protein